MNIRILYEDKHLLVCEKPIGVLSEGTSATADADTMISLLAASRNEGDQNTTVYPLHRLDRNVGGVMVYAKSAKAASAMSRLIAEGGLIKEYCAICHGDVETTLGHEGELFDLLFKDSTKNKSYVTHRPRRGVKDARLAFRVLAVKEDADAPLSLLHITLGTGRTHQIRVQFSSRRHPLVGDGKYGSRSHRCEVALFACRLSFRHPFSGEALSFSLPLPKGYPWDLFESEASL